eukprot:scaffold61948_cov33-Tisochrysis_lutea.AAC.2
MPASSYPFPLRSCITASVCVMCPVPDPQKPTTNLPSVQSHGWREGGGNGEATWEGPCGDAPCPVVGPTRGGDVASQRSRLSSPWWWTARPFGSHAVLRTGGCTVSCSCTKSGSAVVKRAQRPQDDDRRLAYGVYQTPCDLS